MDVCQYHQPLYRIHQRFESAGFNLSRPWLTRLGQQEVQGKMRTAWFWPVHGEQQEICFPYAPTRQKEHISKILGRHFSHHAQCWSHNRRGYFEARDYEPQHAALHPASAVAELTPRLWKERFAASIRPAHRGIDVNYVAHAPPTDKQQGAALKSLPAGKPRRSR